MSNDAIKAVKEAYNLNFGNVSMAEDGVTKGYFDENNQFVSKENDLDELNMADLSQKIRSKKDDFMKQQKGME